jgi:hypothetical protein
VAPELDWPAGWEGVLDDLAKRLEPLAAEADRRVMTPLNATFKNFMDPALSSGVVAP